MAEVKCSKCGRSLTFPDGHSEVPLCLTVKDSEENRQKYPEIKPGAYALCFDCIFAALGLTDKKGAQDEHSNAKA